MTFGKLRWWKPPRGFNLERAGGSAGDGFAGMNGSWWAPGTSNPSVGRVYRPRRVRFPHIPAISGGREEPGLRRTLGGGGSVVAARALALAALLAAAAPAAGQGSPPPSAPDEPPAAPADTTGAAPADTAAAPGFVVADTAAVRPVPDFWDTGVSGTSAALLTPLMPGWGQLHARNGWRAAAAFGLEWFYWSHLLASDRKAARTRAFSETLAPGPDRDFYAEAAAEYWEQMRDFAWWSGGILLIITLDAYVGANLYAFEEEPLPMPDRWDEHFPPDLPEPIGSRAGPALTLWSWRARF